MPAGTAPRDAELDLALRRLLSASVDFSRAYHAWSADPLRGSRELDEAERRLDDAEREATLANARATGHPV